MVLNEKINVRAVLFDYDDTIMDVSEARNYARQVIAYELSSITNFDQDHILGVIKDVEIRMESVGQFDRRIWFKEVAKALNVELSIDEINKLVRVYWDSWRLRSRLFPDVMPTLSELRRCGFRLGIVTNTDGEPGLKRGRIRRDGIDEFFDLIVVAGDDTKYVKPHPEPFIRALHILGMPGNEVIYIGDRVSTDVPGPKAVGMYVGIIKRYNSLNTGDINDNINPKPDFIINSLFELLRILECL
ncbi:MAG: HAD family hydrolase [Vulcanisaeta sp.]|uniref:Haloacid dehalogenase-like hydrolase n=1 Tax=Vulcanisaeta moutnovskia (strain 768-28) TaxID=985053 RepID=F0QYS8_VULM7|nr:HAD-IA family hydrolase [Vulcanisaeta moutnovskia]ADY01511.1 haloacid dehalogenase-like hydrolase [Vulcanisaeta moutnovskia 768-28]